MTAVARWRPPGTPTVVAWAVVVFAVAVAAFSLAVAAKVAGHAGAVAAGAETTLGLPFAVMGALIVSQRPDNRIGWLLTAIGASSALVGALSSYVLASVWFTGSTWPATIWVAWLGSWLVVVPAVLILVFLPLTYPTGRLPSPAWRPVPWLTVLLAALFVIGSVIGPDPLVAGEGIVADGAPVGPSPTRHDGAYAVGSAVGVGAFFAFLCVVVASIWSLRLRYQRADGIDRLQIKWLLFGVLPVVGAVAVFVVAPPVIGDSELAFDATITVALWAFPVAVGGAVLRHRLFDIDRLVSRTLAYALLTVLLTAVYSTVVLVLGLLFGEMRAGVPRWVVAAATLAVAALFQPARRRIQRTVDRRFNRRRYDATKVIAAFGTRLRDELDRDALMVDLLEVIDQVVQPAVTSLWLRPSQVAGARTPPPQA